MKSTNDFLKIKNQLLADGMTVDDAIDIFDKLHRKYLLLIGECDSHKEAEILKAERFSCFCVLMSLKTTKSPPTISYIPVSRQLKIA